MFRLLVAQLTVCPAMVTGARPGALVHLDGQRRVIRDLHGAHGVTAGRPGPVTLAAAGLPPGVTASFSPATVQPGRSSVLTVAVPAAERNGSYPLEITGTDASATQYADAGLTITGGETLTVSGLSVADPANAVSWFIQQNLQPGDLLYGDRTFTVASVPAGLAGATWIRTANSSKTVTTNPLVTFSLNVPATVSVAVDTRVGRRSWMDSRKPRCVASARVGSVQTAPPHRHGCGVLSRERHAVVCSA